ncbi:MAG TPA: hypothetical protein VHC90_07405 [Bryobacteraceae bacterium]|nr:hypothetical protein [Bryobacteraceae bacterium]
MPVSEDELLTRLLLGYAEAVRSAAALTRHLGLAARAGDHVGFATVREAFEAARKRSESYRLAIQICREMKMTRTGAAYHPGWSVVPPAAPPVAFAPHSPDVLEFAPITKNAA